MFWTGEVSREWIGGFRRSERPGQVGWLRTGTGTGFPSWNLRTVPRFTQVRASRTASGQFQDSLVVHRRRPVPDRPPLRSRGVRTGQVGEHQVGTKESGTSCSATVRNGCCRGTAPLRSTAPCPRSLWSPHSHRKIPREEPANALGNHGIRTHRNRAGYHERRLRQKGFRRQGDGVAAAAQRAKRGGSPSIPNTPAKHRHVVDSIRFQSGAAAIRLQMECSTRSRHPGPTARFYDSPGI